jgi:D-3-phosphoglycerate dehydrogenase
MDKFRVAMSGDFVGPDGAPAFPMVDMTPLTANPMIEVVTVAPVEGVMRAEDLAEFDALMLLAPRFNRESIPRNGRLAVVARFGVGFDTVDVPACTEAGIVLCTTPDGVRRPMAVATVTLMLGLTGRLFAKDRLTREAAAGFARRADYMGVGLVGKTLGVVGVGNIGAELFRMAKPFDMRFIAADPYVDPAIPGSLGVELMDIDQVFREADIVSIHCPLNEETRGFIDARRLSLLKPTAFLINTARGPIVDQRALTEVLAAGRIAGAGLDVLEKEPPDPDDPILKLDNAILTPHALGWTEQCFAGIGAADVAAILAVSKGDVPRGVVNKEVLTSPAWTRRLDEYRRRAT